MLIGVPREIKTQEYRVGMSPESAAEAVHRGHEVLVETAAGGGIGANDEAYRAAGARVCETAEEVFDRADLLVKVKEPQPEERARLRAGQVLFCYLHLAPDPVQARDLIASGAVCIAYETVTDTRGLLPLLRPMSQVAGRLAIQAGATALEMAHGGRGVLLGGVPGVAPGHVLILGGGVVGFNAAQIAVGLHADVTILDRDPAVLDQLALHFESRARVVHSNRATLDRYLREADLVVGAVLVPGAAAPRLVTREMLGWMRPGAVLLDVSIDQGGCFETSRPTTHDLPTFVVDGIVHYGVANIPGAVPHTSTYALNNATLPYVLALAGKGWRAAMRDDPHLRDGLNVCEGQVTHPAVAAALGYAYVPAEDVLGVCEP
ncbi:MAG: alanine dehydrogenase [Thiocapsa sp.]|jgi:alanine dehydrogenase|nr:alanine dehydrogenase [Thiocapsa sp.]MCG6897176.1 alanine dehydrogenase [Thiocapsa sp.]MCG6986129.1 alanine dehydrogenase [Thiocapsa sp.]